MPLDRLSTAASTTNQPPNASSSASRARSAGLPAAPAPVAEHQQREGEQADERERQQPAPWSPRPAPNSRKGPVGPPKAIGLRARPLGSSSVFSGPSGAVCGLGRFARACPLRRRDLARDAAGADGIWPGPPVWPPTRPKPL